MKMKNIKILRILTILALGFLMGNLSSCDTLIDDTDIDFGEGPVLATFAPASDDLNIIKDAANTPIDYEFEVTYAGGRNVALDTDVTVTIAASPDSEVSEGTGFEIITKSLTIPAGSTTATGSIKIFTESLVPFEFKDLVLEITDSSESIAELNTFTLALKALDANTLAGTYTAEVNEYWNSGSFIGDFAGREFVIAAISPGLYLQFGFGPFPNGGDFYFTVDETTGVITTLPNDLEGEGVLLNGSPIMTCAGGQFEMVPCDDTTNKRTLSPDGHHIIELTTGYFRGAGSTREFLEKLVRN